jgi:hypothetical protein
MALVTGIGDPIPAGEPPIRERPLVAGEIRGARIATSDHKALAGFAKANGGRDLTASQLRKVLGGGPVKRSSVKRASQDAPASVGELGELRRKRDAYIRRVDAEIARLIAHLRERARLCARSPSH